MKRLKNWITRVRLARNMELPLWIGSGGMLIAFSLASLWPVSALYGLIWGALALAAGFVPRRSLQRTAADLDREFHSANRFESALELEMREHPLRKAQEADTLAFWDAMPHRNHRLLWRGWIGSFVFLLAAGMLIFLWLIPEDPGRNPVVGSGGATEEKLEEKKTETGEVEPEPFKLAASIELTYPEENAQFTPIDILEFEAKAVSNATWEGFLVRIGRNGETVLTRAAESPPPENGIAFPGGAISLDELEAEPHDLVTLQLTGITAGKEILAPTYYIRLKNLREDIVITECPPGAQKMVERIREFIVRQIALGKLLSLGRNAFGIDPGMDTAPFGELSLTQKKLEGEVAAFVRQERDKPDTRMTADMFRSLNAATGEMEKAAGLIGLLPVEAPRLAGSASHQERAVAHLNKALREVVRAINRNRDRSAEAASSAEKKPQQKAEENPGELLKRALEKEREVLSGAAAPELPEKLNETQGSVSWLLRMVTARGELSAQVLRESETALESSLKCEEAIRSTARNTLKLRAEEAVQAIGRALEALRTGSTQMAASGAGEARTALAEAEREAAKQQEKPAGEMPRKKMAEAAEKLREAAGRDRSSGSGDHAGKLEQMAEKVEEKTRGAENRSGSELAKELRDLRGELGEIADPENGREPGATAEKLDELSREAAYRAKRHNWNESARWRNELEETLEGAGRYWRGRPESEERRRVHSALMPLQNFLVDFEPEKAFSTTELKVLIEKLEIVRLGMEAEALKKSLPTALYLFQPDRIPEEYREAAAKYFEALSRLREKNNDGN